MLPDESLQALKQMQDFVDILDGVIKDLSHARDALNGNLNIIKNPFNLLMLDGDEAQKEIKDNGNKAQIYIYLASNKLQALGSVGEEESDERSE